MKKRTYSSDTNSAITPALVVIASILALLDAAMAAERWMPRPRPIASVGTEPAIRPVDRCAAALPEELRDMIGHD